MPLHNFNPNHPTLQLMDKGELYVKLLLILTNEHGTDGHYDGAEVKELLVTNEQIGKALTMDSMPCIMVRIAQDGVHLYMIKDMQAAHRIAKKQGGLPV